MAGVAFVVLSAAGGSLASAEEPLLCPAKIETGQKLTSQHEGWEEFREAHPLALKGVAFFKGHPGSSTALAPDSKKPEKGGWLSIWRFTKGSERWVECSYQATSLVLRRRLEPEIAQCRISYHRNATRDGLPVIRKLDCI